MTSKDDNARRNIIHEERVRRGMSVRKLSQKAAVDYADVWRIDAGQNTPEPETFEKLKRALGMS